MAMVQGMGQTGRVITPGSPVGRAISKALLATVRAGLPPQGEARELGRIVYGPGGVMRFEPAPGVAA